MKVWTDGQTDRLDNYYRTPAFMWALTNKSTRIKTQIKTSSTIDSNSAIMTLNHLLEAGCTISHNICIGNCMYSSNLASNDRFKLRLFTYNVKFLI